MRLTMLVSGGFFMFSFPAISTASVCNRPGDPRIKIENIHVNNLVYLANHGMSKMIIRLKSPFSSI